MNNLNKQVHKGVKWTTVGTVVIATAAILKLSVLTRLLDKSDFGLMALVTFVMGFMNLFNDMGLTTAILHKQEISKKEYASLYWLNLLFSIVLYLLLLAIAPVVANFYEEPQLQILIALLGLNLLISALGRIFKTIESKHLEFKKITIFEIIAALLSLGLAIYLAIMGYGVFALVYSALCQYLVQNILYMIYGLKKYGLLMHFKFNETRPFLKIGVYQVGGQLVNYFNRDLDILIIGKFFSQEILGGYSLARELVRRPVSVFGPIINKVGAPTLAIFTNDPKALKLNFLRLINIVASISIPLYLCLVLLAKPIVLVLYGSNFEAITILVQILAVNMIFRFIGGSVGNLVTATGRTDLEFWWNILNLIITPTVIFIAAQFSIKVVAIAVTGLSAMLYYPSWRFFVKRLLNVSFMEYSKAFFIISISRFKEIIRQKDGK
jgi:O-antigen/teichoic acid export membrane protein